MAIDLPSWPLCLFEETGPGRFLDVKAQAALAEALRIVK